MNTYFKVRRPFACGMILLGAAIVPACSGAAPATPDEGSEVQDGDGGVTSGATNDGDAGDVRPDDPGSADASVGASPPEACVGPMNSILLGIGPRDIIAAAQTVAGAGTAIFGANNWSCRSKPAVILVHGGGGNIRDGFGLLSFAGLASRLVNSGYCVFIPDYDTSLPLDYHAPDYDHLDSIRTAPTTALLEVFIEGVLLATGQEKVNLLAHSLGGGAVRSTIRGGNLAPKINALISLDCPAQTSFEDAPLGHPANCPGCDQVWGFDGGAFWNQVNGADGRCSVLPGIAYTSLALAGTSYVSIPYLDASGGHATNALFYSSCVTTKSASELGTVACSESGAIDIFETRDYLESPSFAPRRLCPTSRPQSHIGLLYDAAVGSAVVAALDAGGLLPSTFEPDCP